MLGRLRTEMKGILKTSILAFWVGIGLSGCNGFQTEPMAIPTPTQPQTSTLTITPTHTQKPTSTPIPARTVSPTSTLNPILDDPLANTWDIECLSPGCLMFLDIGHGSSEQPDYLTIAVAVSRDSEDIEYFAFIVPEKADVSMGLAIIFADSESNSSGEWELKLAEDTFRVLPFEGCKNSGCTARVLGGTVPPIEDYKELDLLEQFLNHRLIVFLYWVDGEEMKASTTLSGFQAQFARVLEEDLN